MWTPKRVLILIVTLVIFLIGYSVHWYLLGDIDDKPLLPPHLLPKGLGGPVTPPPQPFGDRKLRLAFGEGCKEVGREIKLDLHSKGYGLAADHFKIESDGRVKLTPFSACLFPKAWAGHRFPEINTVRCQEAYLTMDQPIKSLADLSNRRVVGVELRGLRGPQSSDGKTGRPLGITIVNNRRTPAKNDDIELRITNGPLFFDDGRHEIWTDGFVQLLDTQSQPHPTKVTAKGLELHLTSKDAKKTKDKRNDVTGVDRLVLRSNVRMDLYVDSRSGFLASTSNKPATSTRRQAHDKSHIIIETHGPFSYDIPQDMARFESPAMTSTDKVSVMRVHKLDVAAADKKIEKRYDKLECNKLDLQFRRKQNGQTPRSSQRSFNKEIETAHATAYPEQTVKLDMQSENLNAWADEMYYQSPTGDKGPQTILKGKPLQAGKDGNQIEAHELHLIGANKQGKGQRAFATGPGRVDLFDRSKKKYLLHALFQETLTSLKHREDGKVMDLLTLTGQAAFIDDEHDQELHAERLQVWLEPTDSNVSSASKAKHQPAGNTPRQRPYKIDAFQNVFGHSKEFILKKSNHVLFRFKDEMPEGDTLPDLEPTAEADSNAPKDDLTPPDPNATTTLELNVPSTTPDDRPPTTTAKRKNRRNPLELTAREVVVYVTRIGSSNQLQELVTEGAVHVHQEPKNKSDKGVDIRGEMLNLLHHPNGDVLFVFGDSRKPARLQLGKMALFGPKVTINQQDNVAEVDGIGAMTLPSNTTLQGGKPTKPGTPLTINWNKSMLFRGKHAEFRGGVIALQEDAKLRCQNLEVTLDRVVSFKEGQKTGQDAKVERLLCDRKVFIVDEKHDKTGSLTQYNRLQATELSMDNQAGPTIATGPGQVDILAKGSVDPTIATPGDSKKTVSRSSPSEKQVMKLTRITFFGRMFSNKHQTSRTSKFYDNVEVFHIPSKEPEVKVDPDKLPEHGFYLRCDLLSVYTKILDDDKTTQQMTATGKVYMRSKKFFARAEVVKYNESSELVVFEGSRDNPVSLYELVRGGNGRQYRGLKILYNRRTGQFKVEGGNVIRSQ